MAYFEATKIKDSAGNLIDPVDDSQVILLRRIVKLLETQSAVDPQQRQRITLDSIASGLTLGTITTVTTVSTVSAVTNIAGLFSWNQQILSDPARTSYNTGIRSQLTFS
jgi:hypothetical protein